MDSISVSTPLRLKQRSNISRGTRPRRPAKRRMVFFYFCERGAQHEARVITGLQADDGYKHVTAVCSLHCCYTCWDYTQRRSLLHLSHNRLEEDGGYRGPRSSVRAAAADGKNTDHKYLPMWINKSGCLFCVRDVTSAVKHLKVVVTMHQFLQEANATFC